MVYEVFLPKLPVKIIYLSSHCPYQSLLKANRSVLHVVLRHGPHSLCMQKLAHYVIELSRVEVL